MNLSIVGVTYKNASVDIRGMAAFTSSRKDRVIKFLEAEGINEVMILSTCNRSEIYVASDDAIRAVKILRICYEELATKEIGPYLFEVSNQDALEHLFGVACGLDSLVLGEDQILGQLKEAMEEAIVEGHLGKHLGKAVREAITFSKKMRSIYKFSENQLSVAAIGVKYLKERHNKLENKRILLVGTGSMGQLILKYLRHEGIKQLYITNRTYKKELFEAIDDLDIEVIDYEERYKYMNTMDIVISATASPHMVIQADKIEGSNETLFMDMAVPRDIDPAVIAQSDNKLVTIDDFNQIANRHMAKREASAQAIRENIWLAIEALNLWLLRSKVDKTIQHLRVKQSRALVTALNETKEILKDEDDARKIGSIIERAMWSMIKEPIKYLKTLEDEEDIHECKTILNRLYNVDEICEEV